jgi:hypothetical protein
MHVVKILNFHFILIYFSLLLFIISGVGLSPLGTAATSGLLYNIFFIMFHFKYILSILFF